MVQAAARDATAQVRSAMLQQLTASSFFKVLELLAEATALWMKQCSVTDTVHMDFLQDTAARLLAIQVGCGLHSALTHST